MKTYKLIALLLVLLPTLLPAQKKSKKPELPAILGSARYVYVEAVDGNVLDPTLYPEDRQAIVDVENSIRDWKRYTLTTEREQAELIFVVRKGRLAGGQLRGGINGGSGPQGGAGSQGGPGSPNGQIPGQQSPLGTEMGVGGKIGPPDDLLQVRMVNSGGKLSGPIWINSRPDGLNGPRVQLFEQYKTAVERAYPTPPATQPAKP